MTLGRTLADYLDLRDLKPGIKYRISQSGQQANLAGLSDYGLYVSSKRNEPIKQPRVRAQRKASAGKDNAPVKHNSNC